MKKTLASSFITVMLISVSNISYAAFPLTTGEVKFQGDIIESTCNASSDPVKMGTYHTSEIKAKETKVTGSEKNFKIKLTECPVTAVPLSMEVTFSGSTKDTKDSTLLALDSSSTAKGIGIGIYDAKGMPISLSSTYSFPNKINNAVMEIPLQAAYVSNGVTAEAGTANATLKFEINYK
ncbi:fimbrial protein [Xenorhabdus sp. SGI246]|uniref:fimbrial protein n=1 Tax=Xenorhabdus sp. SGI246 TaxID=3158263 RepID=UPI00349F7E0A